MRDGEWRVSRRCRLVQGGPIQRFPAEKVIRSGSGGMVTLQAMGWMESEELNLCGKKFIGKSNSTQVT